MVKKAIIIQVLILGLLALVLIKPDFFDVRLKEAQKELDFWKLVKKTALDTTYFKHLDVSKGKFIIIGWGSYNTNAFPMFDKIIQNRENLKQYKVVAVSPFVEKKEDITQLAPYSGMMTFKFNEIALDVVLRGIPFMTIPQFKEERRRAKEGKEVTKDAYAAVIVLDNNIIIWAKTKVSDFSEIELND